MASKIKQTTRQESDRKPSTEIKLDPALIFAASEAKINLTDTLRPFAAKPLSDHPQILEGAKDVLSYALEADKLAGKSRRQPALPGEIVQKHPTLGRVNFFLERLSTQTNPKAIALTIEELGALNNEGPEVFGEKVARISHQHFANRGRDLARSVESSLTPAEIEESKRLTEQILHSISQIEKTRNLGGTQK